MGTRAAAALGFALACLLSGLCTGCYTIQVLDTDILRSANETDDLRHLALYLSARVVLVYESADGTPNTRLVRTVRRGTAGAVVDADGAADMEPRRIWVSFERDCVDRSCAFGFVHDPDGRYVLSEVPVRTGYGAPSVFRSAMTRSNEMQRRPRGGSADAPMAFQRQGTKPGSNVAVFAEVRKRRPKRAREAVVYN